MPNLNRFRACEAGLQKEQLADGIEPAGKRDRNEPQRSQICDPSSLPQESMMDRFEMMTSNSEQIVNRAVDTEKPLGLSR